MCETVSIICTAPQYILYVFQCFFSCLLIYCGSEIFLTLFKSSLNPFSFNLDHKYGEAFFSFKDISLIRIDSSVLLLKMLSRHDISCEYSVICHTIFIIFLL
jgi:hypothetical protein